MFSDGGEVRSARKIVLFDLFWYPYGIRLEGQRGDSTIHLKNILYSDIYVPRAATTEFIKIIFRGAPVISCTRDY